MNCSSFRGRLVALASTVVLVILGGVYSISYCATKAVDPQGNSVVFTVPAGATLREVADELASEHLIRSAIAMRLLARLDQQDAHIRAGEYELSPARPLSQVLDHLTHGPIKTYPFSFPEGATARAIAQRLEGSGLVQADRFLAFVFQPGAAQKLGVEGQSLEGYLFPETYRIPRSLSPEQITSIFVEEFLKNWEELTTELGTPTRTMREVVTLASIVEKETADPAERPMIAAVFSNRLRRGMRLETDPTVIYGIANFDGNLTKAQLLDGTNPYNTYKFLGLPPGPIANPGRAALRAVLAPAENKYLYFVSRNDGTHYFSKTYAEHARAVVRYQKRRRRR